jgi:hypothetical protein
LRHDQDARPSALSRRERILLRGAGFIRSGFASIASHRVQLAVQGIKIRGMMMSVVMLVLVLVALVF